MYELEPAPGVKASRVIQLAGDVARNMSALSARIATIPGRTVIGIELPNVNRESVVLHELIRSEEHTSELQSLMRISYAVFCLKKKTHNKQTYHRHKYLA